MFAILICLAVTSAEPADASDAACSELDIFIHLNHLNHLMFHITGIECLH
jgi:hypothetical protein